MDILILSGDKTNFYLHQKMLEKGYSVQLEGFHHLKKSDYKPIRIGGYKTIITPIPFTINNSTLFAPYSEEIIHIDNFLNKCDQDCTIIGGPFHFNDKRLVDITQNQQFRKANIIPTVEEIIKIIIEESDYTIYQRPIHITGSGDLSTHLKDSLERLGAIIIDDLSNTDIIINTSNSFSLDREDLEQIKDSWIIDVTSEGLKIDNKQAKNMGLKIKKARGLPGKSAPASVADYLLKNLEELQLINR